MYNYIALLSRVNYTKFMLSALFLPIKVIGACIVVLFIMTSHALPAEAIYNIPSDIDLNGYAWSSTIGWISMNCATGSATSSNICATSNYKVTVQQSTGNLIGYAWNSNIGWIRFNGLSSFPVGTGNVSSSARVRFGSVYPSLTYEGWIRACAGTNSIPNTCASMTNSTTSGAWDGWISLRGTTPTYNSSSTSANFTSTSFGWGSSVVGWVSFDPVTLLIPGATLSALNCEIPLGGSSCNSSTTWAFTNTIGSTNIHNFTAGSSYYPNISTGVNNPVPLEEGQNYIQARADMSELNEVSVTATCISGTDFSNGTSCQTIVLPPPSISITTDRTFVRSGETVTVNWTIMPDAVSPCNISGPGVGLSTLVSGSAVTAPISNAVVLRIDCTGPFGNVSSSTRVNVIGVIEEV